MQFDAQKPNNNNRPKSFSFCHHYHQHCRFTQTKLSLKNVLICFRWKNNLKTLSFAELSKIF